MVETKLLLLDFTQNESIYMMQNSIIKSKHEKNPFVLFSQNRHEKRYNISVVSAVKTWSDDPEDIGQV